MHQIRAITIDLDDTLWEIAPVIQRAEAELWRWLRRNCPAVCERFTADAALAVREQVIQEYRERTHDFRFLRRMTLTRMLETCGYSDAFIEDAFEVFDLHRNRVKLYPDVVPALERLSERFPIVAVTNGNANLQTIGIRHLFSDVVSAVEVGSAKPAPLIFEEAVRRAGAAPIETLHVGDHPECDIAGAQGAGLATAWMNRTGGEWPDHLPAPDAIVTTVTELHAILEPSVPVASR
ncbi:MAG TPA: HAD family hydrolase [Woeseiaceae bacterium]|nr:HAD family hydrolase [Woeseiaceae bacterium]